MSQLPRPVRPTTPAPAVTLTTKSTLADFDRALPPVSAVADRAEAPSPSPASWPDLLRLLAEILQDGIPLLEKGGKANVFQLLMLFAKVQAAWAAFKALRNPPAV